jgi:GAF domain-containing protein
MHHSQAKPCGSVETALSFSEVSFPVKSPSLQTLPQTQLYSALNQLSEGLILLDANWELQYINRRAASYLAEGIAQGDGQEIQALVGQNLWQALPHLQAEHSEFYSGCQRSLTEQLPLGFECEGLCERESLWIQLEPSREGLMVYLRSSSNDQRIVQQQQQYNAREALLTSIAQRIQQKEDLHTTFQITVQELLPLFRVDRALLYHIKDWETVELVAKATAPDWPLPAEDEHRTTWVMNSLQDWVEGSYYPVADVDQDDVTAAEQRLLRQLKVRSQIVVPIFLEERFWGLLALHQCTTPRHWRSSDIELLKKVVMQMTLALQQDDLCQQVGLLNADLETQVQERTTQLQKALDWEAMLKRITDKVRDSLDENQILQKAVQELALVMGMEPATRRSMTWSVRLRRFTTNM